MYTEGFEFFRSGYGAAVTVVFLAFVLLLAAPICVGSREHYGTTSRPARPLVCDPALLLLAARCRC